MPVDSLRRILRNPTNALVKVHTQHPGRFFLKLEGLSMPEFLSPTQRSALMAKIRAKDTVPELVLRSHLHRLGLRFRTNVRNLPGSPDVVLKKYRAAIFVHGCFWHSHKNCAVSSMPRTNRDFWREKFRRNIRRDARNQRHLRALGWRVFVVWECRVKSAKKALTTAKRIATRIKRGEK